HQHLAATSRNCNLTSTSSPSHRSTCFRRPLKSKRSFICARGLPDARKQNVRRITCCFFQRARSFVAGKTKGRIQCASRFISLRLNRCPSCRGIQKNQRFTLFPSTRLTIASEKSCRIPTSITLAHTKAVL